MIDNSKPFRLIDFEDLEEDPEEDAGQDSRDELVDERHPQQGSPSPSPLISSSAHRPRRRLQTEPVEKLDLNAATVEELEELPGVGPLRARRIIALRNRRGAFGALDDLRYVRGMGARSVQDLSPYLRVALIGEEDDEFRGV